MPQGFGHTSGRLFDHALAVKPVRNRSEVAALLKANGASGDCQPGDGPIHRLVSRQ
jgi:hypothetical protein